MEKKKKLGRGHSHSFRDASQMNMRGIFLHVLADALGSVVVVISALVSNQCLHLIVRKYVCYFFHHFELLHNFLKLFLYYVK